MSTSPAFIVRPELLHALGIVPDLASAAFTFENGQGQMTLPNSRTVVSYSTKYYKFVDDDVPAVLPDQRIDPNWPDWQAGRDPVMGWILRPGS